MRWADSVRALQRYPELTGFGESVIVPASQLSAFAARAVARPCGSAGTRRHLPGDTTW